MPNSRQHVTRTQPRVNYAAERGCRGLEGFLVRVQVREPGPSCVTQTAKVHDEVMHMRTTRRSPTGAGVTLQHPRVSPGCRAPCQAAADIGVMPTPRQHVLRVTSARFHAPERGGGGPEGFLVRVQAGEPEPNCVTQTAKVHDEMVHAKTTPRTRFRPGNKKAPHRRSSEGPPLELQQCYPTGPSRALRA